MVGREACSHLDLVIVNSDLAILAILVLLGDWIQVGIENI